jgi:hypothetical protein
MVAKKFKSSADPKASEKFPFDLQLNRNTFSLEFTLAGSTILNHVRFARHARKTLADEGNYFGLWALDTVLKNKKDEFRRCGITPKINHVLQVFFTVQNAYQSDKEHGTSYLTDRPDLDLVLALLHDEGEDTPGFTKEYLKKSLENFIENIDAYVEKHNKKHPYAAIALATPKHIQQMRTDIDDIVEPFDLLTKRYKGQPKRCSYYAYHARILGKEVVDATRKNWHARATRVKIVDKAANGATFVYRSEGMLYSPKKRKQARADYYRWVTKQIGKMRDIYQNQNFLQDNHAEPSPDKPDGFTAAAVSLFPQSSAFIGLIGQVIDTQLRTYDTDLSNEDEEQNFRSPSLNTDIPEYEKICLSPSINLIHLIKRRLTEATRLDKFVREKEKKIDGPIPKSERVGMFGIPFRKKYLKEYTLPPSKPYADSTAFYSIYAASAPSPCS